jgi:ABC-type antimicrobial peptide transport system permease subunit
MALGADAGTILREVLLRGGRLVLVGIVLGVVLAAGVAVPLRTLLLDVSPFDPLTYLSVSGLFMVIALLASFVPSWRATVVDPLIALRTD